MPESLTVVRVVLASPSDVARERRIAADIIDGLSRNIGYSRGLFLRLLRWETDAPPAFHPQGPQAVIDAALNIPDCDLFVGILWKRFGSPTMGAGSGTEHEFRTAYAAWKARRRPQIMVYFNTRLCDPESEEDEEQARLVRCFRDAFPKEGLWGTYRGHRAFKTVFTRDLTTVIANWNAAADMESVPAEPPLAADPTQPRIAPTGDELLRSVADAGITQIFATREDALASMLQDIRSSRRSLWISAAVYVGALIKPKGHDALADALETAAARALDDSEDYLLTFCSFSDILNGSPAGARNAALLECWRGGFLWW